MRKVIGWAIPDFSIGIAWGLLATFIPDVILTHYSGTHFLSVALSCYAIFGVITQLLVGYVGDILDNNRRKYLAILGVVLAGVSQYFWGYCNNFYYFLALSITTFIGVNVLQCSYYSMLLENNHNDSVTRMLGFCRILNCIGGGIIGILSVYILRKLSFISGCHILSMLICVPALISLIFFIKIRMVAGAVHQEPIQCIPQNSNYKLAIVVLNLATFIVYVGATSLIHLGSLHMINDLSFSVQEFSYSIAFMNLGTMALGLFANKLMRDYLSYLKVLAFSLFLTGILFIGADVIFLSFHYGTLLFVFYFLYGALNVTIIIGIYALMGLLSPLHRIGYNLGWLNVSCCLGQVFGVNLFSYFMHSGFQRLIFGVCASFFIMIAMILAKWVLYSRYKILTVDSR